MKRNSRFVEQRVRKVGFMFELKKRAGLSSKAAVIEIAEIYNISVSSTHKYLARFNREVIGI